jgi:hypothetical protein
MLAATWAEGIGINSENRRKPAGLNCHNPASYAASARQGKCARLIAARVTTQTTGIHRNQRVEKVLAVAAHVFKVEMRES